jgi:hypothetical protein
MVQCAAGRCSVVLGVRLGIVVTIQTPAKAYRGCCNQGHDPPADDVDNWRRLERGWTQGPCTWMTTRILNYFEMYGHCSSARKGTERNEDLCFC